MTENEKVVIPTTKIHKMLKQLGIARTSKDTAAVLAKFINETIDECGVKAFKYTQAGARSTISPKDMLAAIKDKKPDFEYELE